MWELVPNDCSPNLENEQPGRLGLTSFLWGEEGRQFPSLAIVATVKRRGGYYNLNVFAPMFMFVVLSFSQARAHAHVVPSGRPCGVPDTALTHLYPIPDLTRSTRLFGSFPLTGCRSRSLSCSPPRLTSLQSTPSCPPSRTSPSSTSIRLYPPAARLDTFLE